MNFNRLSIICVSILLIIIGVSASLSVAMYLSWIQAKEMERDKLFAVAKRAIYRSRFCLNEASQALDALDGIQPATCSAEHVKNMRDILFNKHCINEIEYHENGTVKCSTEGAVGNNNTMLPGSFVMPDDVSIIFDTSTFVKQGSNFIGLRRNNYTMSVDTNRLTDVIIDPYIKVIIVTDEGHVISSLNYFSPNPQLIKDVLENPNLTQTKDSVVTISRTPGLYYIVSESMSYLILQWKKNLVLFLPFGLIMSLIASAAVVWALRRRLSPLGELKLAVAHREFIVHYQPLIDFKTELCIGAEALVRWQRPDGSMVRPDLFIPLAEDSGLIQPITDQIIQSIVKDLKDTLNANRNFHIAINVAVVDFNTSRIFKQLESILAGSGINPQQVWLEITERGFMDMNATTESLQQARKLGYPIVMDDFGTGYSCLSYLKELPINVLKIDKSFIDSVHKDSVTSHVTEHIINIAKTLNLQIVAEGVETKEQAEYLKAHEVDFAQGWLYAKAMPLKEFLSFYQKNAQHK